MEEDLSTLTDKELFSRFEKLNERGMLLIERALFFIIRFSPHHPYKVSFEELQYSFPTMDVENERIEKEYQQIIPELKKRYLKS